jgi:hypothetical protein
MELYESGELKQLVEKTGPNDPGSQN